jgi:hypothetical protein
VIPLLAEESTGLQTDRPGAVASVEEVGVSLADTNGTLTGGNDKAVHPS